MTGRRRRLWKTAIAAASIATATPATARHDAGSGRRNGRGGAASHTAPAAGPKSDGYATWYTAPVHGPRTASGERFDPSALAAAHVSAPLGTLLRITDPERCRSVVVRVNDREPRHGHRIVDLTPAAARVLGIVRAGRVPVTVLKVEADERHAPER